MLSIVMLLLGGYVILGNYWFGVMALLKKEHSSWVPVLGGGCASVGCLLSPHMALNKLWWVPLFADLGCVPGIIYSLVYFVFIWVRNNRKRIK
jgi:hypothetical protein